MESRIDDVKHTQTHTHIDPSRERKNRMCERVWVGERERKPEAAICLARDAAAPALVSLSSRQTQAARQRGSERHAQPAVQPQPGNERASLGKQRGNKQAKNPNRHLALSLSLSVDAAAAASKKDVMEFN